MIPDRSLAARPPEAVRRVIAGRPFRTVWRNELGGLTFEVHGEDRREFVKWVPHASGIDLHAEMVRLQWASRWVSVPEVLDHGADGRGAWLVTAAQPGENAVSDRWHADPLTAVTAIGRGLRALHDRLPVASCPFSWSLDTRVADVRRRAEQGRIDPAAWHPEHRSLELAGALCILADPPPIDRIVVCHGDACAPNTLVGDDGHWTAHVDLGQLGVADRWADLAIATWSTEWNYGPGWEGALLAAYGVEPDSARTQYYRLLWDLGP